MLDARNAGWVFGFWGFVPRGLTQGGAVPRACMTSRSMLAKRAADASALRGLGTCPEQRSRRMDGPILERAGQKAAKPRQYNRASDVMPARYLRAARSSRDGSDFPRRKSRKREITWTRCGPMPYMVRERLASISRISYLSVYH